MSTGQFIFGALAILVGGYFIYRVKSLNSVQRKFEQLNVAAKGHIDRVDEAIKVSTDQIAATRENSELLRELIALNKKMLEKQERPDS